MLHPLLRLIATQPQLLADHAEGYADLVAAEAGSAYAAWKRSVILNAAGLCSLGVSTVLVGVALMLWAVTPVATMQAPWALVVVPLPTLALAVWCLLAARGTDIANAFDNVRRQVKADMAMLRSAAGS